MTMRNETSIRVIQNLCTLGVYAGEKEKKEKEEERKKKMMERRGRGKDIEVHLTLYKQP